MTIGIYDTAQLAKVIRTVRAPSNYFLSLGFGTEITFQTKEVDFDIVDESRRLAPFVAPTAQGAATRTDGYVTRRFTPAYIKPKDPVEVSELIRRQAGEALMGELTMQQREDLAVAAVLERHRKMIERRWEWMGAQALQSGQITVTGKDYPTRTISFGRSANMTKNLTGTARWNDPAGKPLDDIENWSQEMHRTCGFTPTRITMGLNAWAAFKNNPQVNDWLESRRGGVTVVDKAGGNGEPWQLRFKLDSGLEVWTYNDIYEDDQGNQVNFMDQDSILLTSPAVDGVRCFGAIQDRKVGYAAVSMFSKMWEQDDPSALYLMTQSAPLMVPTRPDATMFVKVVNAS